MTHPCADRAQCCKGPDRSLEQCTAPVRRELLLPPAMPILNCLCLFCYGLQCWGQITGLKITEYLPLSPLLNETITLSLHTESSFCVVALHELRVAVRLLYLGSYCIVLDQMLMKNKQDKQNTDRGFRNKVVPHLSLSRPLPLG